ncbi:MAG TPA: hypothetical protein VM261_03990 [Kofleriaceae bacterium]|nr:hypothetical protein [Kofleriaceae bacterium]
MRSKDLVAVVGLGVSVWLYFAYGWKPALGAFAAVWLVMMVVSISETKVPGASGSSDQPVRAAVVDYRPAWEKAADVEARSPLANPEDERSAQELVSLLAARDSERIREIGKQLDADGGHERMVRVCLRVKHLGGDASALERRYWDGIGAWQG